MLLYTAKRFIKIGTLCHSHIFLVKALEGLPEVLEGLPEVYLQSPFVAREHR
jgi:hypothetical protein